MSSINNVRTTPFLLELGGKMRELRYDLNAFAELEKRFGNVDAALAELQKGSLQSVKMILWTGLIHQEAVIDPITGEPERYNITPYQVGSWVDPGSLAEVGNTLSKALEAVLPTNLKEELKAVSVEEVDVKRAKVVYTPEELLEIEEKKD